MNFDYGVSCNGGSDGAASVTADGGTPDYTYLWSNGETTETASNLAAGLQFVTITDANGCMHLDSVMMTEPDLLVIDSIAVTDLLCYQIPDGTATVSVSGGAGFYTYNWSNGATTTTAFSLMAGTYTVTVTDDNGCTVEGSAVVNEPTELIATSQVDMNVSCFGLEDGSASAMATGGTMPYTYDWSTGETTASISDKPIGTYTVTISDDNGCVSSSQITITEPPLLESTTTLNNDVTCFGGNDGSATVNPTGGVAPYTYVWSTGETNATALMLDEGTQFVTITDNNGCTTTDFVMVNAPAELIAGAVVDVHLRCYQVPEGAVTASAEGGVMPYTFLWNNGATTATNDELLAGTYTVTVTDANGCTSETEVTLDEPEELVVTATTDKDVTCYGLSNGSAVASTVGGIAPYTYEWSNGQTSDTANNLTSGLYDVTVTDANGCTAVDITMVMEPDSLQSTVVLDNDVSCNGGNDGAATVSPMGGTMPYTFIWSNGETTASATELTVGEHYVSVIDDNGCIVSDTIVVSEPELLLVELTVDSNVSCFGAAEGAASAVVTGGVMPYTYEWSNGATTASIMDVPAGLYNVTITDANGCIVDSETEITEPTEVIVTVQEDAGVTCPGGSDGAASFTVMGGVMPYTYLWSNGVTSTSITDVPAGIYDITVTDANECVTLASVEVSAPDTMIATINLDVPLTCSEADIAEVTVNVTGGTAPYNYMWTNGNTSETATGLTAGIYGVAIQDANYCIVPATILIEDVSTGAEGDIYVDATATGANDGSSWEDAYTDLQDALMGGYYRTIHVAEGTYYPSVATQDEYFEIMPGMVLMGGYPAGGGMRDADMYTTILSGDLDQDGSFNNGNSFHVVLANNITCAVIDGVTIKHGNATGSTFATKRGGGLYVNASELTLRDVKFRWNKAEKGGAFFASSSSVVNIEDSSFRKNRADYGSAIYSSNNSDVMVRTTEIIDNTAAARCAVELHNANTTLFDNSVIADNHSANANAIRVSAFYRDHTLEMYNSTVVGELKDKALVSLQAYSGYTVTANYYNSIIAHQDLSYTKGHKEYGPGEVVLTTVNCYIQGESINGTATGNLYSATAGDIMFNPDFSLEPCSPAVDAGDDAYAMRSEDIVGNPRMYNTVDMGAHESQFDCEENVRIAADLDDESEASIEEVALDMSVSPNPTTGMIKVSSDVENPTIFVFNTTGTLLQTTTQIEVDLSSYPSGLYMIVVEKDGQLIGTEKVMKR